MKNRLLFAVLFLFVLVRCADENEKSLQPEKVQFSFRLSPSDASSGRTGGTELPPGTSLLLSIENAAGNPVLTQHPVSILSLGDGYITTPLDLGPGKYTIVDFLLVDELNQILFATPLKGSPLGKLVENSLPYSFHVSKNKVSNVPMEVISTNAQTPEAFGYVSFPINIVNPLSIAVFAAGEGEIVLTEAELKIFNNVGESYVFNLDDKVNTIPFKGDAEATYTLEITKEGYETYSREFNYTELLEELNGNPFEVVLQIQEALILTANGTESHFAFWLFFNLEGKVTIDWGDGSPTEEINFADFTEEFNYAYRSHQYETEGTQTIKVTGDLHQITEVQGSVMGITGIYTSYLPGLQNIGVYDASIDELDLSNNFNLTGLSFTTSTVNSIVFPVNHSVNDIYSLESDVPINDIVDHVYSNAIAEEIYDGDFLYYEEFSELTPSSVNKLQYLIDELNWSVSL
ncbi:MAG TPA: hypothetical protein VD884_12600 [Ohtaekwangia sp.]|nr:hypothetical protein [Ohtaekwangia sp.]